MGFFPELMGTVPEILTNDRVANPVPEGRALISIGGWRMFGAGISAGLTDWADVGFSLSRGVHSTVRLVESGGWALSVSPAYFSHVTREGDETALSPGGSAWTRVTNLNLTGLLAYRPFRRAGRPTMDVFVGSGHSWYRVDIRDQWREHRSTAPTIVGGFTLDAGASRPQNVGMGRLRISAETAVTFLTQRDGRRDFVVTNRFQMAVQRLSAW